MGRPVETSRHRFLLKNDFGRFLRFIALWDRATGKSLKTAGASDHYKKLTIK
jgi:hypothetical protein